MDRLTSKDLEVAIVENVEASARMITDELSSYRLVGRRMQGGHERVTHSKGEYVRTGTDVHTNTVEGVFSADVCQHPAGPLRWAGTPRHRRPTET